MTEAKMLFKANQEQIFARTHKPIYTITFVVNAQEWKPFGNIQGERS